MADKQLTTRQQDFLNNLPSCGGDVRLAAEKAPKAAMKLVSIMDSAEPIPQANMRLQAAQQILDRVGLGKTERLDVNVNTVGGLFVIPAKKEVVIDGDYTEV